MKLYGENTPLQSRYTNQQLGKINNMNRIFSLIRKRKDISRSWLAKETALTPTTVSMLVDELCACNFVNEKGIGQSITGRKPIMLEVNPDGAMFPVVSLCKTGFQYTLYDLGLNILEKAFRPFPAKMPDASETTRKFVDKSVFSETVLALLKKDAQKIDWDKVPAICFSYIGSLHWDTGTFSCTPLRAWTTIDFINDIYLGINKVPIFIQNATINIAYAEMNRRNQEDRDFVFMNIRDGVGVGWIAVDRENYTCKSNMLELGHVSIELNGRKCACGNRGCVERYINTNAIVRDIRKRIENGENSELTNLCGGDYDRITLDMVRVALENDDALVSDALRYIARCLAAAISNMACILESRTIVIGGGIERLGKVFLNYVRESLNDVSMKTLTQKLEITYVTTATDAESEGIVQQYIDNLLPEVLPTVLANIAIPAE